MTKRTPKKAALKVETVAIAALELDPRNARRHPERNLESIKASLERFGQQKPIVVDGEGVIVAGNGTFAAAKALGWKTIDVVRTRLRGAEARAYAISDNRTAELAEWDAAELSKQLEELSTDGISAEDLAFSDEEVEELLKGATAEAGEGTEARRHGGTKGGGGSIEDQYKVVITCKDEPHQADLLDALDRNDGGRLGELLKDVDCRALVG